MYKVELSDRRNIILYEKLKRQSPAEPFEFKAGGENGAGGVIIFSPARKINAEEAKKIAANAVVIGGGQSSETLNIFKQNGIAYKNLMEDEEYVTENSKLTAEAALCLLIEATEKSIFENNILILGYGRLGKALALLFSKLSLNVAVCTFNKDKAGPSDLYVNKSYVGESVICDLNRFDVIINTIPAPVLTAQYLNKTAQGTVIIELASVACADTQKVADYAVKYIKGPGLPAKYCPESAADAMLKSIFRLKL